MNEWISSNEWTLFLDHWTVPFAPPPPSPHLFLCFFCWCCQRECQPTSELSVFNEVLTSFSNTFRVHVEKPGQKFKLRSSSSSSSVQHKINTTTNTMKISKFQINIRFFSEPPTPLTCVTPFINNLLHSAFSCSNIYQNIPTNELLFKWLHHHRLILLIIS